MSAPLKYTTTEGVLAGLGGRAGCYRGAHAAPTEVHSWSALLKTCKQSRVVGQGGSHGTARARGAGAAKSKSKFNNGIACIWARSLHKGLRHRLNPLFCSMSVQSACLLVLEYDSVPARYDILWRDQVHVPGSLGRLSSHAICRSADVATVRHQTASVMVSSRYVMAVLATVCLGGVHCVRTGALSDTPNAYKKALVRAYVPGVPGQNSYARAGLAALDRSTLSNLEPSNADNVLVYMRKSRRPSVTPLNGPGLARPCVQVPNTLANLPVQAMSATSPSLTRASSTYLATRWVSPFGNLWLTCWSATLADTLRLQAPHICTGHIQLL